MRFPISARTASALLLAPSLALVLGGMVVVGAVAGAAGLPQPPAQLPGCGGVSCGGGGSTTLSCGSGTGGGGLLITPGVGFGTTLATIGPDAHLSQSLPRPTFTMATTPGRVTLATNQARYQPCDTIAVGIANGLTTPIYATDHHTSCSLVTLQRLVNGTWQTQGSCAIGTLTHVLTLAPGAVTGQTLTAGRGFGPSAWPAGTYRLVFTYSLSGGESAVLPLYTSVLGGVVYSASFSIL
ncbi:MAG: hypothetical protein IVW57_09680 [Ktedonobacterales bacterium]|nr:hypothetical protein [Ktedonobacterales bacterium]